MVQWVKTDIWGSLASQPSITGKLQVPERPKAVGSVS